MQTVFSEVHQRASAVQTSHQPLLCGVYATSCADTFTTVLLPEEDGTGEEQEAGLAPSPLQRARQPDSCSAGGRRGGEEEEVVVPLSAQVQARLEGVCVQVDTFAAAADNAVGQAAIAEGGSTTATAAASTLRSRVALVVRALEVRDSFQPRKGGGAGSAAAAAAVATGWAGLRRMLGYHASVHRVRHPKACQVQLVVEAIQAEPGAGDWPGGRGHGAGPGGITAGPVPTAARSRTLPRTQQQGRCAHHLLFVALPADLEYRLHVQLLPLLLHLDQAALAFLQHFFAPESTDSANGAGSSAEPAETCAAPGGVSP